MARIRGDGSSGKGAVMLSAHLDTVKAPKENWEEAGWKHDPFGAEIDEEDGCIYGRGTIDMKNMAAMSAAVLLFIARSGIKLTRDLIFAAVADEENVNSAYGAKYLLENHSDLIACDVGQGTNCARPSNVARHEFVTLCGSRLLRPLDTLR